MNLIIHRIIMGLVFVVGVICFAFYSFNQDLLIARVLQIDNDVLLFSCAVSSVVGACVAFACRFTNSSPRGLGCLSRPLGVRGSDGMQVLG